MFDLVMHHIKVLIWFSVLVLLFVNVVETLLCCMLTCGQICVLPFLVSCKICRLCLGDPTGIHLLMEEKPFSSSSRNEGRRNKKKLLKGKNKMAKEEANTIEELAPDSSIDHLDFIGGGDEVMANNEMADVQNTSYDMSKDENDDDYTTSQEVKETELPGVKAKKDNKRKRQLMKEAAQADNRGICYLSRIPPRMDHVKLRHLLSHYGEVQRIYLAPGGRVLLTLVFRSWCQDCICLRCVFFPHTAYSWA